MLKLEIRDQQTGVLYYPSAAENTVVIETPDGVKVKLHPIAIKTLVKKGQQFDGHTITGPRRMERLK